MNCPNCNYQNEDNALTCKNCGADFAKRTPKNTSLDSSSILLFIFVCFHLFMAIVDTVFTLAISDWYQSKPLYCIRTLCWILSNVSFILPAIAIKKKALKIVAIILTAIYVIYYVSMNISNLIKQLDYLDNWLY